MHPPRGDPAAGGAADNHRTMSPTTEVPLFAAAALAEAFFYSDSANDLPLLLRVGHPVAVDPDARLLTEARRAGWAVLTFDRAT